MGYVEEPDGGLLVAAGSDQTDWGRNLLADPHCAVVLAGERWTAMAEPLEGPDAARAVKELILRYGTPAERLGQGPAFRLRRAASPAAGGS